MSLPDLAAVLWRQRELLDRLAYKLECEQLMLAGGRTRWLATATGEVETTLEELGVIDLQRAAVSDAACRELDLPTDSSLEDVAAAAQPPWTDLFMEHRNSLLGLTAELAVLAETSRSLTTAGLAAVESTLAVLGGQVGTTSRGYDSRGRTDVIAGAGRSAMFDRAL